MYGITLLLLSVQLIDATPYEFARRYDLDHNGVPDMCSSDGTSAYCLDRGRMIAVPATGSDLRVAYNTATETVTVTSVTTMFRVSTLTATTTSTTSFTVVSATHVSTSTKTSSRPRGSSTSETTLGKSTSTTSSSLPTTASSQVGRLPSPAQFALDRGKKWTISYQGNLQFSGLLGTLNVGTDKARTGTVGGRIVWNFGDMLCGGSWETCGFSMGPAFYGTNDVMKVDTANALSLQGADFVQSGSSDIPPQAPYQKWGMDTSNIVPIDDTRSVAIAWEVWRNAVDGSDVSRGNAVALITQGSDRPIATRPDPLLTGPDAIQLGLLAILRVDNYIYTYSIGGPSNLIIGRAPASNAVFDASYHEFLQYSSDTSTPQWQQGIPFPNTTSLGATTANLSGKFGCAVYGSVHYNTFLQKYLLICSIFESFVNMYTSDTPYGPWSAEYSLTNSDIDTRIRGCYGSMTHAEYGADKEIYLSTGPNGPIYMYKLDFSGYAVN